MALVSFNNLLMVPFAILIETAYFDYKVPYNKDVESLPTPLTLLVTIPFCILVEDMSNSATHWFFHRRFIYPYIHKVHHTHVTSIGLTSEYAHPIEFLLGNLAAIALGPLILKEHIHLYTMMIWFFIRISETIDVHSGYDFSWSPYRLIPFSGSAEYHDFHHTHNIGNYASFFTLWDTVFGNNSDFYQYMNFRGKFREYKPSKKVRKLLEEEVRREKLIKIE